MIPRIAKGGHSFKGAFQYFCHDKGQSTKERIVWTQTDNIMTSNPDLAWKVMAYTALEQTRLKETSGQKSTGRKLQKPVFSYSLAWHPEQNPDQSHMLDTARKSLAALGMTGYETLIVAHRDEPQRHVHIIVNRVHPVTGMAADLSNTKQKLSEFSHAYEQDNGKVYCKQREQNIEKRKEGKKTRYTDPNIIKAWNEAADGKSFALALKKQGYQLAQGKKRLVVIDPHGKIINPTRHLEGVKAKDVKKKIGNANLSVLFDAASVAKEVRRKQKEEYLSRQGGNTIKAPAEPSPAILNRLQDKHLEERSQLFNRQQIRIEKEQEQLKVHYKIEERQKTIQELTQKTENPSVWRRLFGFARQDRNQLADMQKQFSDVQHRIEERMKSLEHDRQQETLKLIEKQANEKTWLYQRGTDAVQPRLVPNPAKKKEREFDLDR